MGYTDLSRMDGGGADTGGIHRDHVDDTLGSLRKSIAPVFDAVKGKSLEERAAAYDDSQNEQKLSKAIAAEKKAKQDGVGDGRTGVNLDAEGKPRVKIVGLVHAPEFNNTMGTFQLYDAENDRYIVKSYNEFRPVFFYKVGRYVAPAEKVRVYAA